MPSRPPPTADQEQAMIAAYQRGMGLLAAAKAGGFRAATVCRDVLDRRGIPRRNNAAAMDRKRMPLARERYFADVRSEEQAYYLGWLTADGCLFGTNRIVCTVVRSDRGQLERFAAAIGCGRKIGDGSYVRNGRTYLTSTLNFRSPDMHADLQALGLTPRKSLTVRPWPATPELAPAFWRGVVDGDGCLCARSDGYWSVSLVGSRHVVQGFADFVAERIGHVGAVYPAGRIFRVHYGGTGLPQAIAALLYRHATAYLPRKKALADRLMAEPVKHPFGSRSDHSAMTPEKLNELHRSYGGPEKRGAWARVSEHLGVTQSNLNRLRKRLGMM